MINFRRKGLGRESRCSTAGSVPYRLFLAGKVPSQMEAESWVSVVQPLMGRALPNNRPLLGERLACEEASWSRTDSQVAGTGARG